MCRWATGGRRTQTWVAAQQHINVNFYLTVEQGHAHVSQYCQCSTIHARQRLALPARQNLQAIHVCCGASTVYQTSRWRRMAIRAVLQKETCKTKHVNVPTFETCRVPREPCCNWDRALSLSQKACTQTSSVRAVCACLLTLSHIMVSAATVPLRNSVSYTGGYMDLHTGHQCVSSCPTV